MAYEIGEYPKTCPVAKKHMSVLRGTDHIVWFNAKGALNCRFVKVHCAPKEAPFCAGNSKEELRDKLQIALETGHGYTYGCSFRYKGVVRTGWWLVKNVFKKEGWETSLFVKSVVAANAYGDYRGT